MDVSVRHLKESDLATADRICRLAFGTFLQLPDPLTVFGDADHVRIRWRMDPTATLGAVSDGEIVGSNFAANWGSVAFFGPLTVRPDLWDQGIAKRLLEPTMDIFAQWGIRHAGLFTFPQSPKHVGLYQKFGFYPRFLTAVMMKPVTRRETPWNWSNYSEMPETECNNVLELCRRLTDAIYEGLDLRKEILAVNALGLGDTVLIWDEGRLVGFAVCHLGPGSEAGSNVCYVKFGAAEPGPRAGEFFERLLLAAEALASQKALSSLVAGVNTARTEAYARMLARGFRTFLQGVAMEKPNEPGYNRPGVYLIDDWR